MILLTRTPRDCSNNIKDLSMINEAGGLVGWLLFVEIMALSIIYYGQRGTNNRLALLVCGIVVMGMGIINGLYFTAFLKDLAEIAKHTPHYAISVERLDIVVPTIALVSTGVLVSLSANFITEAFRMRPVMPSRKLNVPE